MKKPPQEEDHTDDRVIYGTHPGDLGVIVIAALCTLVLILVLVLPSPFAELERQQAAQEKVEQAAQKAEKKKKHDEAVASGIVTMDIYKKK
ncbi:MAG: hypothetical protein BGN82_08185 [Alphaproteobacteria bacterium 65-7]|nr:MAG: hypothetical protein BGN82_08185 [Alphaproteobacteria bacterium 65-7]